jgi:signal peptidase I
MKKKILISLVIVVVLGGAILTGIFFYGFRVMSLPAGSMANTILPGEKVAATKFYYEIKRGDIIVFKWPKDPNVLYLKRVIGLPGETIEVRGRKVLINTQELPEKRVKVRISPNWFDSHRPLTELAEEGTGSYRVFYSDRTWDSGEDLIILEARYATNGPFQIPTDHYFMLGDCRDNSQDSRFWGRYTKTQSSAKPI